MYTPLNQAPLEFMKRYEAIVRGDEALDTVSKLKNFWLFAVKQGWRSYEMREWISRLASHVPTPLFETFASGKDKAGLGPAYIEFSTYEYIGESPDSTKETDEEYADRVWKRLETVVNNIDDKSEHEK